MWYVLDAADFTRLRIMKIWTTALLGILSVLLAMGGYAQNGESPNDNLIYITAVDWSSDGNKIVAAGIQPPGVIGYLHVIDVETGQSIYELEPRPGGFASVAWSPDARYIAAGGYDQVVWVVDMEERSHVATLWGHQATVSSIDWNPDGTRLISGGNWDGLVILWDMNTYEQIHSIHIGNP